ncbi:hypothetical protein OAT67_09675 [Bacteriovoracaceae bacterium]|nr:hypothetical protein [Bacteriovoracaceae bacterium]
MKLIILLLSINSLFASTVPTNWFEESSTKNKGSELKVIDTMELIVGSQKEILEKTEADHLFGGWKLSGQKTDVSVSKSGILGFSAVKAASGIELNWTKKSSEKKLDEPKATQIDSSISNDQLLKEVQPSINLALDKVKLNKREKVRSNLEERILLIHQQVKDLENVQSNSWVPNKFRLSISVSQSGNLLWWSELSGDARVRIEWSIKPKNNGKSDSKNKLVEKLVKDIEKSSASLVADNGFTLDKISMGLGLSKKNLFSLVKNKR